VRKRDFSVHFTLGPGLDQACPTRQGFDVNEEKRVGGLYCWIRNRKQATKKLEGRRMHVIFSEILTTTPKLASKGE